MVAGIPQRKVYPNEFQRYAKLTYFGDQRVGARYVSHVWKVGFEFEPEMERGKIEERAVRKLMVDKEGGR